jgi:nucleoside-diphosphate-sugar epimerase
MKILVTGGNGFIGKHLVEKLKARTNREIIVSDRCQDLTDEELKTVGTIFHLGAIPRVGVSLKEPGKVIDNNVISTLRLLEWCRLNPDTLLINVSSSSVKFTNLNENPYALSKAMGEQMVCMYRQTYGINATTVRLFNVYGPGDSDYGKFTTLIQACKKNILTGADFHINGRGITRDYTYVDDVTEGLLLILHEMYSGIYKPLYELGFGRPTSIEAIVEEFAKGTDLKIIYDPARYGDVPSTLADKNLYPDWWVAHTDVIDYIRYWKSRGCPND